MLCRVYQRGDGTVAVKRFNIRHKLDGEPEAEFIARIVAIEDANRQREGLPLEFDGLPFEDVETARLPPRTSRTDWTIENKTIIVRGRP